MARSAPVPLPDDLETYDRAFVTVRQLADHTGIPGRTLRFWCHEGAIPGARRRGLKPESEWVIPIDQAKRIESEAGLTVKHHAA